jgi:hypothetical protein
MYLSDDFKDSFLDYGFNFTEMYHYFGVPAQTLKRCTNKSRQIPVPKSRIHEFEKIGALLGINKNEVFDSGDDFFDPNFDDEVF